MWNGHKFFVVSEQVSGIKECSSCLMATSCGVSRAFGSQCEQRSEPSSGCKAVQLLTGSDSGNS